MLQKYMKNSGFPSVRNEKGFLQRKDTIFVRAVQVATGHLT
jgi:hypothetical protein